VDLSVSPDVGALWCYLIVGVLGALAAVRQIQRRMSGMRGIWVQPRTWILFLAYLLVPVVLFWLLDRTDAGTDTSLFAAVLVGVGYERIITGQTDPLHSPPAEISRFWTPFLNYVESEVDAVRERIHRKQGRADERVVAEIAGNDDLFNKFLAFARSRLPDAKGLDEQLTAIAKGAPVPDPIYVREQKTRLIYVYMAGLPDGYRLMHNCGFIKRWVYYWHVRGVCSRIQSGLVAFLLLATLSAAVFYAYPRRETVLETYYLWRLGKINSTKADQYRTRRGLIAIMSDPLTKQQTTSDIVALIRRPDCPLERVDLALEILLEDSNTNSGTFGLATKLVEGLRSDRADVRSRVNEVLKYLARSCAPELTEQLRAWKPGDGDSTAALEFIIKQWDEFAMNTIVHCKPQPLGLKKQGTGRKNDRAADLSVAANAVGWDGNRMTMKDFLAFGADSQLVERAAPCEEYFEGG
jgi:hypothetical protein